MSRIVRFDTWENGGRGSGVVSSCRAVDCVARDLSRQGDHESWALKQENEGKAAGSTSSPDSRGRASDISSLHCDYRLKSTQTRSTSNTVIATVISDHVKEQLCASGQMNPDQLPLIPSACPRRATSVGRFCLESLCTRRNWHNRTPAEQMNSSCPIQAFNQATLDSNKLRIPLFKNVHVHDTAPTAFAEEASLFPSAIAQAIKVRDRVIVRELKERE